MQRRRSWSQNQTLAHRGGVGLGIRPLHAEEEGSTVGLGTRPSPSFMCKGLVPRLTVELFKASSNRVKDKLLLREFVIQKYMSAR